LWLRRGGRAFRNTQVSPQGRDRSLTFTDAQCSSGVYEVPHDVNGSNIGASLVRNTMVSVT
jgi:hypothetical protein